VSANAVAEQLPRNHAFLIGKYGNRQPVQDDGLVALVQRDDGGERWPIFGLIINNSPTDLEAPDGSGKDLTLRFRESDDRGDADPFFVHATGTVTFTGLAADTDTVTVNDGTIAPVFEFDNTGAITGDVAVPIGATALECAQNLAAAINAYGQDRAQQLLVVAEVDNTGADPVVNITHVQPGVVGNNALAKVGANIAVAGLVGGAEANEVTVRHMNADVTTITVKPGGRAVFIIEAATKEYLRFDTDETDAQGQLVLTAWNVNLQEWQRAL
jgi:hypothetical protein